MIPSGSKPPKSFFHKALAACSGALVLGAGAVQAQGAVDPNIVPRAATLAREGLRTDATELLGRYLATAPGDGRAWFHLGRLYLLGERDWHANGHTGDPSGLLYLDLSALALDQALELHVDSSIVFRGLVEMERALIRVEGGGWEAARQPGATGFAIPNYLVELGVNLLGSCPANGVLTTGNDIETLAVWYASLEVGYRKDVLPLVPKLYATDSLYRGQIAAAFGVDPAWPVQRALAKVAEQRPICLTPFADRAAVPLPEWKPIRLVIVGGAGAVPTDDVLTVTSLLRDVKEHGTVWTRGAVAIYGQAARENVLLCRGILAVLGEPFPPACGQ